MPRKHRRPRSQDSPQEGAIDAFGRARACLQANEPGTAELWLKLWEEDAPDSEVRAARCLDAGRVLEVAGLFDRALSHLADGLALEPAAEPTAYFLNNNTGFMLEKQGHYDDAERFCRAAMRVDRLRYNAQKNLGNALTGQGRYAEAALHLINACRAAPEDRRALHHLQELAAGHPDELRAAWPDLNEEIERLRLPISSRFGGRVDVADAPAPSASAATRKANQHIDRAREAFMARRFEDVVSECGLGLGCDPPDYRTRTWLTVMHSRGMIFANAPAVEALPWVRDAVELAPLDEATWYLYGHVLAALGRPTDAARAYINALRLNHTEASTLKSLRAHVRKFGRAIEANIPDIRERVARFAALAKLSKPTRAKRTARARKPGGS